MTTFTAVANRSGTFETVLFWYRRDLRPSDNRGLAEATRSARRVIPVFVFDTVILEDLGNSADRRVTFIQTSLLELRDSLRDIGSDLIVLHGDPVQRIPELASRMRAEAVFTNRDYDPYASVRDGQVREVLAESGCAFVDCKDQVIFEKDELLTQAGEPYRVFTPYKKAWMQRFEEMESYGQSPALEEVPGYERLAPRRVLRGLSDAWDLRDIGFDRQKLWLPPGETAARERLEDFLPKLAQYKSDRDFPARESTSGLSVHLRFGTISIRELVRAARADGSQGAQTWLSELIWREFYQMILDHFPKVVSHSFKPEYDAIRWPGTEEHFRAWCEGRTGYPIVDAAMRHFNATGWMHNRLRMIVAMFLTKDLLVDWRLGEAYFAAHLLDYDLASNNGGWQWSASTGADGVPYFRIFNPVLQSRRFDPDGAFLRANLPELRGYPGNLVHWPHDADMFAQSEAGCILGEDYPHPIVDHFVQKEKAVALFSEVKTGKMRKMTR